MDNKKKLTVVIAVFAVVCVFAVLVFTGVLGGNPLGGEEQTTESENIYATADYTKDIKATWTNTLPYLKTDIDNIFVTVSKEGKVQFYSFADNTFTQIEADGTYDVTVKMSEQNVSASVSYLKKDGVITGYGLYTGKTSSFDLYPYAFFRLTNYGKEYSGASSKSCLLLVDITADDFYNNEKIYEEAFVFAYSDASCSRLLSEANRTVGHDGSKRSDYTLINDCVIDGSAKHHLFFSGRQYAEEDTRVDLLRSGGSGNNVDNIIVARDVIGNWAKYVDGDIKYIAVDADNNVAVMKYDTSADKAEAVKTFDGVTREDILVSGDYMYITTKNVVYALVEGTETTLDYAYANSVKADMFNVFGDKFIVRGYAEKRFPVCISASLEDGHVYSSYSDEFFRNVVNPAETDSGIVITEQRGNEFVSYFF